MSEVLACCTKPETSEVFGVRLCPECVSDPSLVEGLRVTIKHDESQEIEQISVEDFHDLHIELAPDEASSVSVSFVTEHGGHQIVKIFKEEYQVGDARFDDAIYIRCENRPATEKLLAREGAREAILHLVAKDGAVQIDSGTIVFKVRERGNIDTDSYVRAALALSHHVAAVG